MVKPKYIYKILLTIAALTFCSCKKAKVTQAPQQKESPTQESTTTDEVKYEDLGYDGGLFTLEDKPFTGTSIRCLLYTSPSPRDRTRSRMPSSA